MEPPVHEPIGLHVSKTAKTLSRWFDDALAERGGSLASWLVLTSIVGGQHRSQRSIAADIGVEGPTLTHHLNRMEAAGLVSRQRNPSNRRVHQVELTDAGQDEFRSLLGAVQGFDEQLRSGFTDDELATLRALLGRLVANVTTPSPQPGEPDTEEDR